MELWNLLQKILRFLGKCNLVQLHVAEIFVKVLQFSDKFHKFDKM